MRVKELGSSSIVSNSKSSVLRYKLRFPLNGGGKSKRRVIGLGRGRPVAKAVGVHAAAGRRGIGT